MIQAGGQASYNIIPIIFRLSANLSLLSFCSNIYSAYIEVPPSLTKGFQYKIDEAGHTRYTRLDILLMTFMSDVVHSHDDHFLYCCKIFLDGTIAKNLYVMLYCIACYDQHEVVTIKNIRDFLYN